MLTDSQTSGFDLALFRKGGPRSLQFPLLLEVLTTFLGTFKLCPRRLQLALQHPAPHLLSQEGLFKESTLCR